jgi:tetrahydromethanopterin S-methyltransferase subunit G
MEAMRQSWTDDRLDDFRGEVNRRFDEVNRRFDKVDKRFDKVDRRFDVMAADVNRRFDEVNGRLEGIEERFDKRFDGLQRTLMITGGGIIATLIAGIVSLIGVAVL